MAIQELINKICINCKLELPLSKDFFSFRKDSKDGFRNICKKCKRLENNKWYGNLSINKKKEIINKKRNYSYKNIEKRKKQQKEYRSRPEVKIQKKEYYEKNKKDNRIKKSCYIRERRRNNLCFRLYSNFSCMIYRSIKQNKNFESITKYLPYTSEQLKEHI